MTKKYAMFSLAHRGDEGKPLLHGGSTERGKKMTPHENGIC